MNILELEENVTYVAPDNLLIVDTMNLAFRYKHRGQTDFSADYLRTVDSLAKSYNCREVILTADFKYSKYRKDLSEGYKEGRKDKYKDQTEEEKKKAIEFFEGYETALKFMELKYPLLRFKYVEADDLAAYLVKKLEHKFTHIWLISSDRDWDLLLSEKVSRFSFVSRKEFTLDNFYDEHACDSPEQYISIKVLQGDSGDSVEGIAGVGAKRAYSLVREHGSAMDIYMSLPLPGKQKFVQNLNASGELIPLNYELMDLPAFCEDAIAFPNQENLTEIEAFTNGVL